MNKWHKLRHLSVTEWIWLLEALLLLPLTASALRIVGVRRWQAILSLCLASRSLSDGALAQAEATARIVWAAATYGFWRANCLQQAIVLCWLLRRRGIACELRIGVRKDAQRFEAHAWVEHAGVALNGGGDDHLPFTPLQPAGVFLLQLPHDASAPLSPINR